MVLEEKRANSVDLNKNTESADAHVNSGYDPIAEMNRMLEAYKATNGLKKSTSSERIISPPVPQSYYDDLERGIRPNTSFYGYGNNKTNQNQEENVSGSGIKKSEDYSSYKSTSENSSGHVNLEKVQEPNKTYNGDALKEMDDMLAAYRASKGMLKKESYERVISPPVSESYYDALENSASVKEYKYKRDARNEMDDMINEYRSKNSYKNSLSYKIVKPISMSPRELAERRSQSLEVFVNDSYESKMTDFSKISSMHPDIRFSNLSDGLKRFFMIMMVGLITFVYPLSVYLSRFEEARITHAAVDGCRIVEGTVQTCERQSGSGGDSYYKVTYEYEIDNETYFGSCNVDHRVVNRYSLNTKNSEGKKIKVYVDKQNDKVSKLAYPPSEYPGSYILFVVLLGLLLIIYDIVFLIRCKNGYYYTYMNKGFNKFVKKSHFI